MMRIDSWEPFQIGAHDECHYSCSSASVGSWISQSERWCDHLSLRLKAIVLAFQDSPVSLRFWLLWLTSQAQSLSVWTPHPFLHWLAPSSSAMHLGTPSLSEAALPLSFGGQPLTSLVFPPVPTWPLSIDRMLSSDPHLVVPVMRVCLSRTSLLPLVKRFYLDDRSLHANGMLYWYPKSLSLTLGQALRLDRDRTWDPLSSVDAAFYNYTNLWFLKHH